MTKEEFEASEEDRRAQATEFDIERKQHKEVLAALQSQLDKIHSEERSRDIETKSWEDAVLAAEKQSESLREEVERLEVALTNSKSDCDALQAEMDELKAAFDEATNRDKLDVMEELLANRSREVEELKEEVQNLTETNSSLTKTLNDTEVTYKQQNAENELHQEQAVASTATSSFEQLEEKQFEIITLQGLLEQAKKELAEQRSEVDKVRSSLQEKIAHVQEELETAESELESTRAKLVDSKTISPSRAGSSRLFAEFDLDRPKKMSRLSFSDKPLRGSPLDEEDAGSTPTSEFFQSHALSRRMFSHKSRSRPRSCSPTTIQRLEGDAERRAATNTTLQDRCNKLEDQNRMSSSMKTHLEVEIKQLQKQLLNAKMLKSPMHGEEKYLSLDLVTKCDNIDEVLRSNNPDKIAAECRSMAKMIDSQKTHNAELLAGVLKGQGNIQVCCRIRPMTGEEFQRGYREVAQSLSETELGLFDERTRTWKSFVFEKIWGQDASQKDVFQDVEPMALSVIDGYNSCIFAYGQVRLFASCFVCMLALFRLLTIVLFFLANRLVVVRLIRWRATRKTTSMVLANERFTSYSACFKTELNSMRGTHCFRMRKKASRLGLSTPSKLACLKYTMTKVSIGVVALFVQRVPNTNPISIQCTIFFPMT